MKVPVYWMTNHDNVDSFGPWDTGLLRDMFDGKLWPTAMRPVHHINVRSINDSDDRAVVVLPARHHYSDDDVDWLNRELLRLKAVVLILVGDEDGAFPWKRIVHPHIKFWAQMPNPDHYFDMASFAFFFGNGWRHGFPEIAKAAVPRTGDRRYDWMFAGQVTNTPRKRAANGLKRAAVRTKGAMLETDGFGKGMTVEGYAAQLADAWVAPAPGGPVHVDTFRLYEALELGCVPLVDALPAQGEVPSQYWRMVYGDDHPFVTVGDWDSVGGMIEATNARPQLASALMSTWWQQHKRNIVKRMENDLRFIGIDVPHWTKMTALVTTSPVPGNPDTDIIMETMASIPEGCEVIVACDRVRPEQGRLSRSYDEFLYRIAAWCEHDAIGFVPFIAPAWSHQAALTRQALSMVDTPALLFMEHDAPIVPDETIDWQPCIDVVADGHLHVLRFHHEAHVLPEHAHLMIDDRTVEMVGVPIRRTRQWSQRPAIYNTHYLRRVLSRYFTPESKAFIEDRMHSVAQHESGHRLAIYHPDSGNIKRSYHLDARGDAPKFDESQVW